MNTIQKKLFLLSLALVFLSVIVSASSVSTSIFYDSTTSRNLSIINGQGFGIGLIADSVLEPSMNISLDIYDSSGKLANNLLVAYTTKDSYSNYMVFGQSAYVSSGNYTVVSTVTAASGQKATSSLSLQVLPVTTGNQVPKIISTPSLEVNSSQSYSYQVVAIDPDGDPITYSMTQAPSWLSMNPSGLASGTAPNVSSDTNYVVTVKASDGKDFTTQTYSLTVKGLIDTTPPLIVVQSPTNNQIFTSHNVLFQISTNENTNYAEADFCNIALANPISGNCDIATIVQLNQSSPTSFFKNVSMSDGSYKVVFYANDIAGNRGTSARVDFSVNTSVPVNTPPVIVSSPLTQVNATQKYNYQVLAIDTDNDILAYSLTAAPSWLSINASTGLVSGIAQNVSQKTNYVITVRVSDGPNNVSQTYVLTVTPIIVPPTNTAPVITSTPITSVNENQAYSYQVVAKDSDNDSLTYSFSGPSWLSMNPSTGLVSGTAPSVSANTQYNVTVSVSDGVNSPVTQTYVLTVLFIPTPPTPSGSPAGGAGTRAGGIVPQNLGSENQQYLSQFAPKSVVAEEGSAAQPSGNSLVWIILGVVILIVLLVLTLFLIQKNNK